MEAGAVRHTFQKAVYFLQEIFDVPTGIEYILYKHGPYSFDLTADLTALRPRFSDRA